MIRTYKHKHIANKNKIDKLLFIRKHYIKSTKQIANLQYHQLHTTSKFSKSNIYKSITNTEMTQRWLDVCKRQVDGILTSWLSNTKNYIIQYISKSSLDKNTKKLLYQINRMGLWFDRFNTQFDSSLIKLSRKIFKYVTKINKKPSFGNINLTLNNKVVKVIKADDNQHFDYLLKISSFKRADFIFIPLLSNSYCQSKDGILKDYAQLDFNNNGMGVCLVKDIPKRIIKHKNESMGIDLGLSTLIATNKGDLMGQGWLKKLIYYDDKLEKCKKGLQKAGFLSYTKAKRYKILKRKAKSFIKNEVNRILNKLINIYSPKVLVMESLDFKGSKIGRLMNRLLGNFGKGVISSKISSLIEEGILEVIEVNPSYSSQCCHNCHYVDKSNRINRDRFKCGKCGMESHADVNAAKNIGSDVWKDFGIYTPKSKILRSLKDSFLNDSVGSALSCTQHEYS